MSNLEYSFDNILKSYIDTGIQLTDHQVNLISTNKNMLKTYLRKRAIAVKKTNKLLSDKEFELFKKYDKKLYYDYINYISNLERLYLYDSKLTSLPESIVNLRNLKYLNLSYNKLTSLPESIGNLTNLEELSLFKNNLTTLPESIGNLSNLKKLVLFNNNLTSLPESIGKLTNLEYLMLERNPISNEERVRIKKLLQNTKIYF